MISNLDGQRPYGCVIGYALFVFGGLLQLVYISTGLCEFDFVEGCAA